jgi:hypothetical protein
MKIRQVCAASGSAHPGRLLHSESRKDEDTFDKSCKNDGENEDRGGSTWVAASGFSSLEADQTDTDSCADSCESNVEEWHDVSLISCCCFL